MKKDVMFLCKDAEITQEQKETLEAEGYHVLIVNPPGTKAEIVWAPWQRGLPAAPSPTPKKKKRK